LHPSARRRGGRIRSRRGRRTGGFFLSNFLFALTTAFVIPSSIFRGLFVCVRGRDSVSGSVCFKPSAGHFGNLNTSARNGDKEQAHLFSEYLGSLCLLLRVVMAMTDWQEAVQASILGLIFAFMVAKLVSVVFSFRGENLRVERDPAAPSFTINRELAPADELTAPLASLREEEESEFSGEEFKHSRGLGFGVSGDDEIEKHDDILSSSSSDSETDSPRQALFVEAVLFPASERHEEEEKAMNAVSDEDLEPEKPKAVDTATFVSDEHALQALVCH